MTRRIAAIVLGVALAMPAVAAPRGGPTAARVQPPQRVQAKAAVTVQLVVARERGPVDPGLETIARELKSKGLHSVRRVTRANESVAEGGKVTANTDGRRVSVSLLDLSPGAAKYRVKVVRDGEQLYSTTITAPRGKASIADAGAYRGGKLLAVITVAR